MFSSVASRRAKTSAFSLAEILVVVGAIGVISGILIPAVSGTFGSSKRIVAREVSETVNLALKQHEQVNYKFKLDADPDSADDELAIIRSLQWRDSSDPAPGSPFLPDTWHPEESSDVSFPRLVWTGGFFRLLGEGKPGTGLKLDLEANDYGENYTFPDDFVPVGG